MSLRDALRGLKARALEKLSEHVVDFEPESRQLRVASAVVAPAVRAALLRSPQVEEAQVRVDGEGIHVEARAKAGLRVRTTVVPRRLELSERAFTVHATLPGGLSLEHDSFLAGVVATSLDGLFGVAERAANRVEGVSLKGRQLTYVRPLQDSALLRAVAQRVDLKEGKEVGVGMEPGWLRLDLTQALPPGTQLRLPRLEELLRLLGADGGR
ncbi:MAG TPA: hypothetical protein VFO83_06225 [Aggregicoccus sp.]|nr:hypothetical protein [Aggregicoccus sp.]